jgi:hypothetical protein
LNVAQTDSQREYQQRYAAENAERKREAARLWRAENPERSRASRRQYVEAHYEEVLDDSRRRYWDNRDQLNEERRRRRKGPGGKTPRERKRDEIIAVLWVEQGGLCYLCEEPVALEDAVLEHDHRCCRLGRFCSFCVRGASCQSCNKAIGHVGDEPERLERIARNLRLKLAEIDDRMASKPDQLKFDAS